MPMHDKTEYQFATPGRRILVRGAPVDVGIEAAGRRYAEQLETLLAASGVRVEANASTAEGAEAVVVTGVLPGGGGSMEGDSVVRTAFLRFGGGPVVELTLHAPVKDDGADAEFRRLLKTARPAGQADPVREVARAIEAGPVGKPGHPAGAIELQLTPNYRAPETFALASAEGDVRYRLDAVTAVTPSAFEGTTLGAGVGLARDEEGRAVRYESGVRPRFYSRSGVAGETGPVVLGAERRHTPAALGSVVVEGLVRGRPVRLSVAVSPGGPDARSLGENLMRAMNRSN
jgi:hypothetical protein